jgi:hypothetical protein
LFRLGEFSSDVAILRYLQVDPWAVFNGRMYVEDAAAQSWSPFIGFFYSLFPDSISISIAIRVLNLFLGLLVVYTTRINMTALLLFVFIPAFVLPQDDILGCAFLSIYLYLRNEKLISSVFVTDIVFLLFAFFFIKVFVYAAIFIGVKDWRARFVSVLIVLSYIVYQYVVNGHLLFINSDINNEIFVENSVNLFTALKYLGFESGRIIFTLVFLILSSFLVFFISIDSEKIMGDWLLIFYAFFFYWSPEYTVWVVPFLTFFNPKEKFALYWVVGLAWTYNFVRGAIIRDWVISSLSLAQINVIIGLIIGVLLIYVLNSRFRRYITAQ